MVIAIVGILATIAAPVLLGQRDKAKVRAVVSGAKGAVSEIQAILDAFVYEEPYILSNPSGQEICAEYVDASPEKKCQAFYNQSASYTYTVINDVVDQLLNHYIGMNARSPYNSSQYLFVDNSNKTVGTVVIEPVSVRSIRIHAYAEDTNAPIFDTTVTAR